MDNFIPNIIRSSILVKTKILSNPDFINHIEQTAAAMVTAFKNKKKILFCGNGGSAGDAQHIAAELSGRFYFDRAPLYAEALHVNSSYVTAVANDYSYDVIYERLVEAQGLEGDILVGISTSGNSKNVILAMKKAKSLGMTTIGFTGETGGEMAQLSDYLINVPSTDTPRIQESHIMIGHILCEMIEAELFEKK